MVGLIAKLLLVGLLLALANAERLAADYGLYAYAARVTARDAPVPPVVRDQDEATVRAAGHRTSHVTAPPRTPSPYGTLIDRYATQFSVRPELVRAVIEVESGFDPSARSPVGAMGLMQLMPATAVELGVVDPYDPDENVRGGVAYLKQLLGEYDGDEQLALAAYNAGPGAVGRYGDRIPPFPETVDYVDKVTATTAAVAAPRAPEGMVYKSYAIVDGWWTVVYSNVAPESGPYELTPAPVDWPSG